MPNSSLPDIPNERVVFLSLLIMVAFLFPSFCHLFCNIAKMIQNAVKNTKGRTICKIAAL